jgi:uncharacterized repeat protein (TIGR01451 family)
LNNDTINNPKCNSYLGLLTYQDTTVLFRVIVTDNSGVTDTATWPLFISTVRIDSITTSAPNNTICAGMPITLTVYGSDSIINYTWACTPCGGPATGSNPVTIFPYCSVQCTLCVQNNHSCGYCFIPFNHFPPYYYNIIVNNCPYNIVRSAVFYDQNHNGIWNAGEFLMPDILPKITPMDSVISFLYNDDLTAYVRTGTYNVTPANAPYYTQTTNPTFNLNGYTSDVTSNIGVYAPPGIKDIKVYVTPYYYTDDCNGCPPYLKNSKSSGIGYLLYYLRYSNVGTDTLNGVLKVKYDAGFDTFSLHPMVANSDHFVSILNDTLTWQYYNLRPGESRELSAMGEIINPVIGNGFQVSVIAYPLAGDSNTANNYDTCYSIITGSWDPNFKEVDRDSISLSQVMAGTPLTYTIHFQNTGNDTAIFVKVRDTISPKLDKATFEMISASHPYILTDTTGNVIQWKFNNIMLPDSGANQLLSNGFIKYRITPFTSLNDGDSIENHASIYFDNNAPVMTNRAMTYIEKVITSVNKYDTSPLVLSPNPTNGLVNILLPPQFGRVKTLELYNVMGQLQQVLINANGIDISGFSAGLYFVLARNEKGEVMHGKVVKE